MHKQSVIFVKRQFSRLSVNSNNSQECGSIGTFEKNELGPQASDYKGGSLKS